MCGIHVAQSLDVLTATGVNGPTSTVLVCAVPYYKQGLILL